MSRPCKATDALLSGTVFEPAQLAALAKLSSGSVLFGCKYTPQDGNGGQKKAVMRAPDISRDHDWSCSYCKSARPEAVSYSPYVRNQQPAFRNQRIVRF